MIYLAAGAASTEWPFALWNDALATGTLAGSATPGFSLENALGPQTYDYWKPINGAGFWECVLPAPVQMDCIAFAAHNMGSAGVSLIVQSAPDLATGYTGIRTITPTTDDAVAVIFAERAVQKLRFYATAWTSLVTIGATMAGKRLIFPGWVQPPYVPMQEARRVELRQSESLGGHYIGATIKRLGRATNVTFSPLPRAFVDADLPAFRDHFDAGQPFFFAGGPATMPDDIGYCWRAEGAGELRAALRPGGTYAEVKMGLAAYGA